MNTKTLQLIGHLRVNSREKLTSISKKTGIPISTLFDTLKELQGSFITKSTVLLDYERLGFHTRAHVFLKVAQDNLEGLGKHLDCNKNVNSIYKINNGWNFVAETIHKNNRELDTFLSRLHEEYGIEKKEIHYLIEDVKREGFLINP